VSTLTTSDTPTETGTDTGPDDLTAISSLSFGIAGLIVSGDDQQIDTGSDTGSWSTTDTGGDTDTATLSDTESDTGDATTDSTSETGSDTDSSSGSSSETTTFSESMTEDLGAGGVVTGGGTTETTTETSGSSLGTTETSGASDTLSDMSSSSAGIDTQTGRDTDSSSLTATDTAAAQGTETLTEVLGADGTITSGAESDSLSETSGDTTTETDHPTETLTDSVSDVTMMTPTETISTTTTDNETDEEWACETLGTSATIAAGSDCFTIDDLDTSDYHTSGSGPEDSNDTYNISSGAEILDGARTIEGSGSSSAYTYQTFGDLLGVGGDISSGSLTYTVSHSDTDDLTTIESGTEAIADELTDNGFQTASYDISTTTPDDDTAYETGTETLGEGGTISGGLASFGWSQGNSESRNLTISGIAATLSIGDDSTDTYGFGESGTETITTGGADAPGTISFVWNQMGTDDYEIHQGNSESYSVYNGSGTSDYVLNLTDTVSSSWHDVGADALTDSASVTGETDSYTWTQLNSVTDNATETAANTDTNSSDSSVGLEIGTYGATESFSLTDTGAATLSEHETDPSSWSLAAETDQFSIQDSNSKGMGTSESWTDDIPLVTESGSSSDDETEGYSLDDIGNDSLAGTSSYHSDSYMVTNWIDEGLTFDASGWGDYGGDVDPGTTDPGTATSVESYSTGSSVEVQGTDSLGPGVDESTMSYEFGDLYTWTDGGSCSLATNYYLTYPLGDEPVIAATVTDFQGDDPANGFQSTTGWGSTTADDGYSSLSIEDEVSGYDYRTDDQNYSPITPNAAGFSQSFGQATTIEQVTGGGTVWGDDVDGYQTTGTGTDSTDTVVSGAILELVDAWGSAGGVPEDATEGSLLSDIEYNQEPGYDLLSITYSSGTLSLFDVHNAVKSVVPSSVPVDLGGTTPTLAEAPVGAMIFGATFGFEPGTASATANGLPTQEATALGNLAENQGAPDGVSRDAPPEPSAVLVALAAAGRNPTDLTLPTAGSEAVDPPGGSHEQSWYDWFWSGMTALAGAPPNVPGTGTIDSLDVAEKRTAPGAAGGLTPGAYVNSRGQNANQRFGNVRRTLTQDFPAFAGTATLFLAGMVIGPEDVILAGLLKAKGLLLKGVTQGGKAVWKIFTKAGTELGGAELEALGAEYRAAAAKAPRWDAAARRWRDPATGRYVQAPTSGKPLHIDIGGEGRYPNATNVNPNNVTSTTGAPGRPIPNHVPGTGQKLPFGNGVADGISLENAPILPETAAEIARVIKPGGSIRLVSPAEYAKVAHQRVIDAVGGTVVQVTENGITTTTITVPR